MNKRQRKPTPFNVTPLRVRMLRAAQVQGNALAILGEGKATGMTRAFRIMVEAGVLDDEGRITERGAEFLRAADPGFDEVA